MKYVFIFMIFSVLIVSAQQVSSDKTKSVMEMCRDSKMPVIVPSDKIDPKIILEPFDNFDSKIEILIPCLNYTAKNTENFVLLQPNKEQITTVESLPSENTNEKGKNP